jgi:hypothetical protein
MMKKAYSGVSSLKGLVNNNSHNSLLDRIIVKIPIYSFLFLSVFFSFSFADPNTNTSPNANTFDSKDELVVAEDKKAVRRKTISNLQEKLEEEKERLEHKPKEHSIPTESYSGSTGLDPEIMPKNDEININQDSDVNLKGEDVNLKGEDVDLKHDKDVNLKGEDVDLKHDKDVNLKGEDVDLKHDKDVNLKGEDVNLRQDKDVNLKGEDVNLKQDKDVNLKDEDVNLSQDKDVNLKGEDVNLKQDKDVNLKGEDVDLKQNKDVNLKGEDVNLKQNKDVNLKGEDVNLRQNGDINLKQNKEENLSTGKDDASAVNPQAVDPQTGGPKEFNIEDELASLSTEAAPNKEQGDGKKTDKDQKKKKENKGSSSAKDNDAVCENDKKNGKGGKNQGKNGKSPKDDGKADGKPAKDENKNGSDKNKNKLPKCRDLKAKGKMPRLAVAFDGSGSMMLPYGGTTRLNAAKSAGVDLVNSIDKNVEIGFVEINGCPTSKNHGFFAPSQRASLISTIKNVFPNERDNKTPLVHGLNTLSKMLDGVNSDDVGILISDGVDTCGITHSVDLCSLAQKLHQRKPRLKVHVILISDEVEGAKCIANITGGKVYKPRDANQIRVSLKQAGADLKKVCED